MSGRRPARVAPHVLNPDFPRYHYHAQNANVPVRAVLTGAPPVQFPVEQLFAAISAAISAINFSTVGNPTGYTLPASGFVEAVREHAPAALLVIDEVYSPFIDVDYTKLDAATPGMVSIRSLSKVGFPGLRVGYAIGHPATLATLARFISPYAVAGPSIIAAITAVRQHTLWDTIIQRHIATRTWLVKHLTAQGTTCYPSPANWVLVGLGPLARTMAKRLADVGILVQCLDHPTLAGYLRISTPNRQAVGQLVRVLAAVVDMQRGGGRYCLT